MAKAAINPSALSPADLAAILTKAGAKQATEERIREHLARGAPTNSNGTIHLVHYTAWLAKQAK